MIGRIAIAIALIAIGGARVGLAADVIDPAKIVDLTYTFDEHTIYWPTEKGFVHQFEKNGETPEHYFYASANYLAPEHGGTHTDAPRHFNADGITLDELPLSDCVGPAAVIDFSARAATDPDAMLSVDDIKAYEAAYGRIPDGAIVVARSGWGKYWPDRKRYMGTDKPGDVAGLRFPGYSAAAVDFLLKNRRVAAIAIDTASMDPGNSKDFPVHSVVAGREQARLRESRARRKTAAQGRDDILHPDENRQGHRRPDPYIRVTALTYCRFADEGSLMSTHVDLDNLRLGNNSMVKYVQEMG